VTYGRFAPTVVKLPDGTTRLENRFTRATGRSPMILPGMTPTTVDAGIVAAAANGGFMAELAGGGQVNERIFDLRMEEPSELLDPGQEVVFNTLFLDPYLWGMHLGRDRLDPGGLRHREQRLQPDVVEEVPVPGPAFTHRAGDAREGVERLQPGTVDQIKKVVAIAKAAWPHRLHPRRGRTRVNPLPGGPRRLPSPPTTTCGRFRT
jgi:fatty acid synthase